jgi:hypothetical protein
LYGRFAWSAEFAAEEFCCWFLAPIVITVSADTAAFTRFFQFMPSLCRLPAMLTVFADCVVQIAFGLSDDAFAVVITVNGMRRDDTPCQEERSHQCHNDSFALDLFKHSPPSVIPGLGCHGGDLKVRTPAATACIQITLLRL